MGLWRSWERASMAWKRSSVRSRSGPPINPFKAMQMPVRAVPFPEPEPKIGGSSIVQVSVEGLRPSCSNSVDSAASSHWRISRPEYLLKASDYDQEGGSPGVASSPRSISAGGTECSAPCSAGAHREATLACLVCSFIPPENTNVRMLLSSSRKRLPYLIGSYRLLCAFHL